MIPQYLVDFDVRGLPAVRTDVVVIGSGIAGLFTAIKAAEDRKVIVLTKKSLMESNTRYAQGGIAAVFSAEDSPVYHRQDTLLAGAGLNSSAAVDVLVHEGPEGVRELIRLGTIFDEENGVPALTKEGAHSHRRILHANGDATGYEIVRALIEQVKQDNNIEVWDDHFVIDLITEDGECAGALVQRPNGERLFLQADATVLCSGERDNCTATPQILRWPPVTGWPLPTGQEPIYGIWNSSSSIRQHSVTPGHRGF